MTRDEVIKMAMETGASHLKPDGHYRSEYYACTPDALERLVQAAFNSGAAAEREECAKFFDDNDATCFWGSQVASHIRARKGGA